MYVIGQSNALPSAEKNPRIAISLFSEVTNPREKSIYITLNPRFWLNDFVIQY